jgi:uncharacterized protein (TIGR02646 family)
MRFIAKGAEPSALTVWKKMMQASPENLNYGNLPGNEREAVKRSLLKEQAYLCAYTLRRLDGIENCHIEHVEPQNVAQEKDLDYGNMAACFPKDGGDTSHGYGAPVKGGTRMIPSVNFVSPHSAGCETRFIYNDKGGVSPAGTDEAAQKTIETLKLDHGSLMELRRHAIEAHGLSLRLRTIRTSRNLKSATEARRFAAEVMLPDSNGRLEPYCVVLAQVALDYAEKEEARSRRLRTHHGDSRR